MPATLRVLSRPFGVEFRNQALPLADILAQGPLKLTGNGPAGGMDPDTHHRRITGRFPLEARPWFDAKRTGNLYRDADKVFACNRRNQGMILPLESGRTQSTTAWSAPSTGSKARCRRHSCLRPSSSTTSHPSDLRDPKRNRMPLKPPRGRPPRTRRSHCLESVGKHQAHSSQAYPSTRYCSSKRALISLHVGKIWLSSRKKLRSWRGCFKWQTS